MIDPGPASAKASEMVSLMLSENRYFLPAVVFSTKNSFVDDSTIIFNRD
jgi:hypothetical protein